MHQFLFDVYVAELISYTWNQLWTFTFLNFEEIIKGEKIISVQFPFEKYGAKSSSRFPQTWFGLVLSNKFNMFW